MSSRLAGRENTPAQLESELGRLRERFARARARLDETGYFMRSDLLHGIERMAKRIENRRGVDVRTGAPKDDELVFQA